MSWLKRILGGKATGSEGSAHLQSLSRAFVAQAMEGPHTERIPIPSLGDIVEEFSAAYKARAIAGREFVDDMYTFLSARCPDCSFPLSGQDVMSLRIVRTVGMQNVTLNRQPEMPGPIEGYLSGKCARPGCGCREMLLSWTPTPSRLPFPGPGAK